MKRMFADAWAEQFESTTKKLHKVGEAAIQKRTAPDSDRKRKRQAVALGNGVAPNSSRDTNGGQNGGAASRASAGGQPQVPPPKRGRPKGSLNKNKEKKEKHGSNGSILTGDKEGHGRGVEARRTNGAIVHTIKAEIPIVEHTNKTLEHYRKVIETLPGTGVYF